MPTIEIDAPWDKVKLDLNDEAGFIQHSIKQLVYYKNDGRVPEQHLLDDIDGYDLILTSDNPNDNAIKFMEVKHEAIKSGTRFESNLAVVKHIKDKGEWK